LTISADELGASYCPECFEVNGTKRYNFEEIAETKKVQFNTDVKNAELLSRVIR
jgi:hypothetical protein